MSSKELRSSKYNVVVSQDQNHIVLYVTFHTTQKEAKESEGKKKSSSYKTHTKKL